ncbi:putative 7-carboxy-7-deazaguanine synthase QueE [Fusibacter sp. 3D3]|uniref:putative 7-carboxy-7-deazaguanine synthase QueE n=1 Tax=Fusibacter sp. 3D3 TaxID=1048380 RepID=UPI000853DC1B|nr:putative 7-carboxy-7-deazaguanine synthase QueE [Fusibacter sp. 3D3]GAU76704.1 queuosine biosynthesis QueE Radical SAM [Fusibacter sp. 3D3]
MKYQVVESFSSINGEGLKAGELAYFIRFAGCNLNCSYCDTKWANAADVDFEWQTKAQIYKKIKAAGIKNVTLTGGEPLLQKGIKDLLSFLDQDEQIEVEIETNGSIDLALFKAQGYKRIAFTMDYKLEGSQMEAHMYLANFTALTKDDVLKFVISSPKELEQVAEIVRDYELIDRCHILLSPVYGKIEPLQIVDFMKAKQLNGVRVQLQLHKIIWNPDERGV